MKQTEQLIRMEATFEWNSNKDKEYGIPVLIETRIAETNHQLYINICNI